MDNNPKRKLSAIVFTDIVGFTELSAKNEPAALDLLNKQREILKPIVEKHEGVWLKEIGDGLLLTFNTSIEAVKCCIEIQKVSKETPGFAKEAIKIGAKTLWLQYGIQNEEAKKISYEANINYIENKCIKQEYQKLFQKSNPVFRY